MDAPPPELLQLRLTAASGALAGVASWGSAAASVEASLLDLDGIIGTGDILEALAQFGCADADFPNGCSTDVDGDGVVGVSDILSVLSLFGLPC